jgi:hypothetical protein
MEGIMADEMKEAKRVLYHAIWVKSREDSNGLTDNEVEIGFLLAKDPQIQEILGEAAADEN